MSKAAFFFAMHAQGRPLFCHAYLRHPFALHAFAFVRAHCGACILCALLDDRRVGRSHFRFLSLLSLFRVRSGWSSCVGYLFAGTRVFAFNGKYDDTVKLADAKAGAAKWRAVVGVSNVV